MPRKVKEVEQEIDIKQKKKPETFVTRWFKDYAVNNAEELKIVCNLTSSSAKEQFYMQVASDNTEVYAVIFYVTFMGILDLIRREVKLHGEFSIEICNSINIGCSNSVDEEAEKVGNFMPIMDYLGINRAVRPSTKAIDANDTTNNFIRWKELNVKKNVEYYKDIQERVYETLRSEYKTSLRTSEAVIPLFCIFMDNIVNVLKMKFKEAAGTDVSEVSINVLGLFDAFYSFNEDENEEIIEFQPNITMKLALKADDIAAGE